MIAAAVLQEVLKLLIVAMGPSEEWQIDAWFKSVKINNQALADVPHWGSLLWKTTVSNHVLVKHFFWTFLEHFDMLYTMYTSVCVCVRDLCPCCGQTSVNLLIPCVRVNVLESWRMIGQIDSYQVFSCFTITLVFCSQLSFLTVWGPDGSFNVHSYGMFGCAFTRTYCGRTVGIHGWQLRGRSFIKCIVPRCEYWVKHFGNCAGKRGGCTSRFECASVLESDLSMSRVCWRFTSFKIFVDSIYLRNHWRSMEEGITRLWSIGQAELCTHRYSCHSFAWKYSE